MIVQTNSYSITLNTTRAQSRQLQIFTTKKIQEGFPTNPRCKILTNHRRTLVSGRKSTGESKGKRFEGYVPPAGSNNCRLDRQSKHRRALERQIEGKRERERAIDRRGRRDRSRRGKTRRFVRETTFVARRLWTLIKHGVALHLFSRILSLSRQEGRERER